MAGCSDGLEVGVREGKQHHRRWLGLGWGRVAIVEMTRGRAGLEKRGIQEPHWLIFCLVASSVW